MPTRARRNSFANPLDALPVIYDALPKPPVDPNAHVPFYERPIEKSPTVTIIAAVTLGVIAGIITLGASGYFQDPGDWQRIALALLIAAVTGLGTFLLITYSSPSAERIALGNPAPHALVLARRRLQSVHRLRSLASTDTTQAAASVAELRADWLERLGHAPPSVGHHLMRPFDMRAFTWTWYLQAIGVFLPTAVILLPAHFPVGRVWLLAFVLVLWALTARRFYPMPALRRRCAAALRNLTCPCCGYDLHGLEPGVAALPALGPKRCPECAARWPLAVPPMPADERTPQ